MKFVAYYRVSTARQGQSGLGLEAQETAVQRLVEFRGGEIINSYREVESGAKNSRPELAAAMAQAKASNATLVVAKLDRLSRDAKFLLTLADSGVPILFGDFPDLDATSSVGRMVLTQMAAVAEFERRRISERVTAALAEAKARGVKLGGVRGHHDRFGPEVREAGRLKKLAMANDRALELYNVITQMTASNPDISRTKLAALLNTSNIPTPSGKGNWSTSTVTRLFQRVEHIHEQQRDVAAKSLRSISSRLQIKPRTVCKRSLGRKARPVADRVSECHSNG